MTAPKKDRTPSAKPSTRGNPLLASKWDTPFELPPFADIAPEHFSPAFEVALAKHREEIDRIGTSEAKPTFANTIVAMEKSGRMLDRVASVFFNLASADTNAELQAIQRDLAPKLAAHQSSILLNSKLFARIDDLYRRRDGLKLDDEQRRILELQHLWFVRAGAKLGVRAKKRVAEINGRLATLSTQFMQNVLADEQSWRLVLDNDADLAGLSQRFAPPQPAPAPKQASMANMSSRYRARASIHF